jgi:HSP20 family protein
MRSVFEDMGRFGREMERLFGPVVREPSVEFSVAYPPVNMWEDAENLYVEAELPGLKLEEMDLQIVEGNRLVIKGERKPVEAGKGVWYRQERGAGKFEREILLPFPVEAAKVEASFVHGVLTIVLPRAESARPRRIPVKAG